MQARQTEGARLTLNDLAEPYLAEWTGKDPYIAGRVAFWTMHLGPKKLVEASIISSANTLLIATDFRTHQPY